jgi:hypothetical protein
LAARAEEAGDGGEEHEPVEGVGPRAPVEEPATAHLRGEDLREPALVQPQHHGVVENGGAVDDAAQRWPARAQATKQRAELLIVGHVDRFHQHLRAACPHGLRRGRHSGCRATPADQHDAAGPSLRQPVADGNAEAAGATGHEVGTVAPEGRRGRVPVAHDDLPGVPSLGHEPERPRRIGEGESVPRERRESTRAQLLHEPREKAADERRLLRRRLAPVDDRIGDVTAQPGHPGRVLDAALAHLDEAASARERPEAGLDGVA